MSDCKHQFLDCVIDSDVLCNHCGVSEKELKFSTLTKDLHIERLKVMIMREALEEIQLCHCDDWERMWRLAKDALKKCFGEKDAL